MIKARDDLAAKIPPGGRVRAVQHQDDPAALQVLTQRGTLGYTNGRLDLMGERIAFADLSIGAGKGSTFRVTPVAQGRKLFLYVADFGQMLKDAGWLEG